MVRYWWKTKILQNTRCSVAGWQSDRPLLLQTCTTGHSNCITCHCSLLLVRFHWLSRCKNLDGLQQRHTHKLNHWSHYAVPAFSRNSTSAVLNHSAPLNFVSDGQPAINTHASYGNMSRHTLLNNEVLQAINVLLNEPTF